VLTLYEHRELFDPYEGRRYNNRFSFWGPESVFFVPDGPCVIRGIGGRRLVINVGSVGQPRRLQDNRASYVLTDGEDMEFRRIEYEWRKTAAKLAELPIDEEERADLIKRLETGI
jgi:hypothetical protein